MFEDQYSRYRSSCEPEPERFIFTKSDGKVLLAYFLGWLVCILTFAFVFWR